MDSNFEHVGNIGVDAGLCWIGDPCYGLKGRDWDDFLERLYKRTKDAFGMDGVCVSTGYGDGLYPVYVRKVDGRVAEVRVVFIEDEEENPSA